MAAGAPSLSHQKFYLWAALLLIVVASLFSFYATNRLITLTARAEHSQEVLAELNKFMSDLQGVETGARGYLITGNRNFLAPYRSGVRDAADTLGRLRRLAAGDRALQARLDRMEALSLRRVRIARGTVTARSTGIAADAMVDRMELGKAAMDEVRNEVSVTFGDEQAEHRAHGLSVGRLALFANLAMAAAAALSLGVILWLYQLRGRDVERRRQAEGELKALNAELEERVEARTLDVARSHALLHAVIENMPDALVLKDARDEFRYVLVNHAGEKLMGRPREEIVGRVDHELFPPDQAEMFVAEDRDVMASGQPRLCQERQLSTVEGIRLIDTNKVPILNGAPGFLLGIVRDVTEQKALENQLRQSQRMHAVGRLTGGIAHDFNNILAIILGNVDLLREQLEDGTEPAEMADEALAAATHGAELVRRLLAFARMQHLDPVAVDLNARLPAITNLLRRTLGEAIRIRLKPGEGLWLALVDPSQVDDALVNLAINARDAMPHGGSLIVETCNESLDEDYAAHHLEVVPGDYVMLAVSDSGTGMSPAVMARAFEPFFTTKGEGRGTGLGLSQVYGWVKQSGGHIKIYSELGHGTTIKLYLPRAGLNARSAAVQAEPAEAPVPGSEKVLVVEDNPKVRATVLRQLADLGYSTLQAEDGESALDLVRAGTPFDLLLTDVVMPGGMTGYELAEQARSLRPGLRILFTSGYTELAAASTQPGRPGPLLSKPYRKRDLGKAVRAVLDGED